MREKKKDFFYKEPQNGNKQFNMDIKKCAKNTKGT